MGTLNFEALAERTAKVAGSKYAAYAAFATIIIWAACGPFFDYSDLWQLSINTATTIVTFLMVFLIQNSQNRGDKAIAVKLDELIRANDNASNRLIALEKGTEAEIDKAAEEIKEAVDEQLQAP
jgi:low affinity Fe/Cu permease